MAVALPGPADAPRVGARTSVRVENVPVSQVGSAVSELGRATRELNDRVRAQQIDNELVRADSDLRTDLDALHDRLSQEGDYETIPSQFEEGARAAITQRGATITAPAARRLWEQRSTERLGEARRQAQGLVFQRGIEVGRAGLIDNVDRLTLTLQDEDVTPQARQEALAHIEQSAEAARQRGFIGADDAARMVGAARASSAEFERTQGMRARAQTEEDRIWTESHGSYTLAMQHVRDIDDPALRDLVEDRINHRSQEEDRARGDRVDAAMREAYALLEGGGALSDLPANVRDVVTRAGMMDTLRNYVRNMTAPASAAARTHISDERQSQIAALQDLNPQAAALVMGAMRGQIPQGMTAEQFEAQTGVTPEEAANFRAELTMQDYDQLVTRERNQGSAEVSQVSDAFRSAREIIRVEAAGRGIRLDGQSNREASDALDRFIMRDVQTWAAAHPNQQLDRATIERIQERALARHQGRWLSQSVRGFEAAQRGAQPGDVRFEDVPSEMYDTLWQIWRRANPGVPVPRGPANEQRRRQILTQMYNLYIGD